VHGIVKSHNGALVLESEPGKGTLARLYFPEVEGSGMQSGRAEIDATAAVRAQGEHILFVDDEPAIVGLARRLLQTMGYRVSCHSSPEQALAAFAAHPEDYALVITDYSMPAMSGVELARALLKIRPGLPILAMSGFLTPEEVRTSVDAGIARVMLKPVSFRRLGAAVSDLLRPPEA
jgi:DNA-binding NtrC family response regulator